MKLKNDKYLLEIDDIINHSEFTEADVTSVFKEKTEFSLENIGEKVYRIAYSAYTGYDKKRQRVWFNWYVKQNQDRIDAMRDAQIEYLRGELITGMGLQDYLPSSSIEERKKNKAAYPPMVKDILEENGLWKQATIEYRDEDLV